jgi:membrane protease YdiL (CAAX protease family)
MKQQWRIPILCVMACVLLIIYHHQAQPTFFDPYLARKFMFSPRKELYRYLCSFGAAFVLLGLVPAVAACLLWDERPSDWGLSLGPKKPAGLLALLLLFAGMLPILIYASRIPSMAVGHPLSTLAAKYAKALVLYEAFLFLHMVGLEFLFRGFLLFGLRKEMGNGAIYLQAIPYVVLYAGGLQTEALAAIPAGLALGHLAARTGSIWYGIVLHWLCAATLDYLVIYHPF